MPASRDGDAQTAADIGIGHQHGDHPPGGGRRRIPPAVRHGLDEHEPLLAGIHPIEQGRDADQPIEHGRPPAQLAADPGGAPGGVDQHPGAHPFARRPGVLREAEEPATALVHTDACCRAAQFGTRVGRGLGQHAVERDPVDVPAAAVRTDQVGVALRLRPAPDAASAVRRQRAETGEPRPHPEFGQQRRRRRGERLTDAWRVEPGPFQQHHPTARPGEPPGGGRAGRPRPDDRDVVLVSHDGRGLASAPLGQALAHAVHVETQTQEAALEFGADRSVAAEQAGEQPA